LAAFLDDVEQLGIDCELDAKQKIDWTIRYAPVEEQEFWKLQPAVATNDWKQFKEEIVALYPGAGGDRKYSIGNLEALTDRQATIPIETSAQFGEYYRAFSKIASFLTAKKRITEREVSNTFLKGLEYSFRVQVRNQLRAENPTHHTDDPWTLGEISKVALFVLSCGGEEYKSVHSTSDNMRPSVGPSIKKETFDTTKLNADSMGEVNWTLLAQEMAKHMVLLQGNNPGNQESGVYRQNQQKSRTSCCLFCSDPLHFIPLCQTAKEYVMKGLCKKNSEGFFIFSNGDRITARAAPGKDIKERVDNWNAANQSSTHVVSTNFFETSPKSNTSQFVWIEEEAEEEPVADSQRQLEEIQMLESLVESTKKKIDKAKRKNAPKGEGPMTRAAALKDRAAQEEREKTRAPMQNKTPQFKYSTPIEDEAIVKKVAQQALDTQVTLTAREILSIAPDVRKHIKDQITTKRTAMVTNLGSSDDSVAQEMFMCSLPRRQDNLVVAKNTEELRSLDVVLEGKVEIEATVDDGSQIIGIRKDKWEEIGIPMRADHLMVMESANKSKDQTLGLLADLKMSIGGYDFYIQVQVVENAPYELLLGRPFFTLTQATTRHFTNGDSQITLVDPNTGAVITMPTRQRSRNQGPSEFLQGF
jgi:hypothetical protein